MHGWRFDAIGKCIEVPSQPAAEKIPPKACTRRFLVSERQGVIWLYGGSETASPAAPPWHEEWEVSSGRARYCERPRLWKCSFVNAVENAIDTTHIPFMHVKTLGAESRALYPRQRLIIDDDQRGFYGEDSEESPWRSPRSSPVKGGLIKQLIARSLGIGEVKREYYRFDLGGSLFYKAEYANGTWDVLVAHSTPADSDHTWFFGISLRSRALNRVGDAFQSWFGRTLCDEDEAEVVAMLSNDASLLRNPVSVVGDEPLLAFRKIYQYHLAQESGADQASSPLLQLARK